MELRNRATGAIITEQQLRADNPNTSFPQVLTPEIIDSFGYDPVLEGPQPTLTPPYEIAVRDGVEEVNGQWFTKYVAGPVFTDTEDATAGEQEAAYKARVDGEQADRVRQDRNKRLSACDWTQVPDAYNAGIDLGAWAAYRQQLRDVPDQQGFPWQIEWPSEPQPQGQAVLCDYRAFYDALLGSAAYAVIRGKAINSSAVLTACVEFIAAIGDAKAGRPNQAAIQACVDLLCAAAQFTTGELQLLAEVMQTGDLDQVYVLPPQGL